MSDELKNTIRQLYCFIAEDTDGVKAINTDQRRIRFVISSDKLDRHGEIVETKAVADAIPAFARNPVCLAGHMHRLGDGASPVIGSWDTDSYKQLKSRSEMDLVFAETPLAEDYWKLYSAKHQRAVSMGFRVFDAGDEMRDGKRIFVIRKIELLEISCVAVPANPDALAKLKEMRSQDTQLLEGRTAPLELREFTFKGSEQDQALQQVRQEILAEVKRAFDALHEGLAEIKSLLTDSEDHALALLGTPDDPSSSAGDVLTEQAVIKALRNIITHGKDSNGH